MYKRFIDIYWRWYLDSEGVIPRINAAEGQALKAIIKHYLAISKGDEPLAIDSWRATLTNWQKLPPFFQSQKDLKQINSNINTIIRHLKNGTKSRISEDYKSKISRDLQS